MLKFFDNLYASIKDKNPLYFRLRVYSFERLIVRTMANWLLPIYFKFTSGNPKFRLAELKDKTGKIIISMTSFPTRINKVWLVIETILRQTIKPDLIILWLSKDQFPTLDILPKNLLKLQDRGLRIELVEDDLRSHKKYYYTLDQFPNEIMITIDDDIFYPAEMVEELMKYYYKFPNSIAARYCNEIKVENKDILPYKTWESSCMETNPNFKTFFGSGGGVLFPPESLPAETLNKEVFVNLCLYADDIWLNTMCRLNKTKVLQIRKDQSSLLPIINRNDINLHSQNLARNLNDVQLKNVRNYFISNRGIDPYFEILYPQI